MGNPVVCYRHCENCISDWCIAEALLHREIADSPTVTEQRLQRCIGARAGHLRVVENFIQILLTFPATWTDSLFNPLVPRAQI